MKAKYFIIGCLLVCLCVPQCKKDKKDDLIKTITIALASNDNLSINQSVVATATITPVESEEEVEWLINSGADKVTLTPNGKQATITAKAAGEAKIQARSASKKAISNEVTVNVDSEVDLAALLDGESFVGTAETDGVMNDPIDNVGATFVKDNTVTVTVTVVAYLAAYGDNEIIGKLEISESSTPGVYNLTSLPDAPCVMDLSFVAPDFGIIFDVTGTYNTNTNPPTLILNMVHTEDSPVGQDIFLTAHPGEREPDLGPAADVAGAYTTTAKIVVVGEEGVEIDEVEVVLTRVENNKVTMTMTGDFGDFGESIEGELTVSATYGLTGTAEAGETEFTVAGLVDEDGEIWLTFKEDNVVAIEVPYVATPDYALDVEGTYWGEGKACGSSSNNIEDVVITLERVALNRVAVTVDAKLPVCTTVFEGSRHFEGNLTVGDDYSLSGTIIGDISLDVVTESFVDPETQTVTLNLYADLYGNKIIFVMTGGPDEPAPKITIGTQPSDATVMEGSITGVLTIAASVTPSGTPSYQWYENTTNSNEGGTEIEGATDATFAIPTTLTEGDYYYYCVVSADVAADPVTSNVATVTVSAIVTPDYASEVVGEYTTTGYVDATDATLTGVVTKLEKVDNNTVAMTMTSSFGNVTGNLTVDADKNLSGGPLPGPMGQQFNVTGSVSEGELSLVFVATSGYVTITLPAPEE